MKNLIAIDPRMSVTAWAVWITIFSSVLLMGSKSTAAHFPDNARRSVALPSAAREDAGIIIESTPVLTTTEAGGTAVFLVGLSAAPTATVTLVFSSTNAAEGVLSSDALVFEPAGWPVTHTLIITGQDDLVADGPISYTVRLVEATSLDPRYNQSIVPDLVAINLDNDAAGITVAPASDLATTELGGTDSFTIALNSAPISPVTVTLASGDSSEGTITPTKAVFTPLNWKVAQNITVTGVDDELDDGDIVYAINTHPAISNDPMYSGLNADDPRVINRNNDFFVYVPLIVLSPPPCTEAPEPGNNTAEGAGILRVNAGICAKSFVGETVKNNDYYALTLEAPAAVTLRLKNTTGAHDLDLYLYDSAKTRLAYSINSGQLDETITQSLSAGTYFVRVYWYEATANAPAQPSYALTAVTTP